MYKVDLDFIIPFLKTNTFFETFKFRILSLFVIICILFYKKLNFIKKYNFTFSYLCYKHSFKTL